MDNKKEFLSIAEVAKILGITRQAVYKQVRAGKIESVKIGKIYVIPKKFFKEKVLKIKRRPLTDEDRMKIEQVVDKTLNEYGDVIKKLGDN